MKKTLAAAAAILSLTLGLPAVAQTMERHSSTTVTTPDGRTMTRTVDREAGMRHDDSMRGDRRVVVRRTVVRRGHAYAYGHHRRCVTRWSHHRRVTRCWRS